MQLRVMVCWLPELPSDRLQETYDRRAEQRYAAPVSLPNPAVDRKFDRVISLVRGQLPRRACSTRAAATGASSQRSRASRARPVSSQASISRSGSFETAAKTIEREGRSAELVRANLEGLPFPDEAFDVVLSCQVLEHLLDPQLGLHELARVIRPGGALPSTGQSRQPSQQGSQLSARGGGASARTCGPASAHVSPFRM